MGLDGEMTPAMIDEVTGILAAAALSSEAESDDYYYAAAEAVVSNDESDAAAAAAAAAAYANTHNIKKSAHVRAKMRVDIKVMRRSC
jgi:predicted nuclease with RNAse H fold